MPRARVIATAALAALATPAAAAAAPTVTTDRPCYAAEDDVVEFSGQGFTPGGQVALFFGANGTVGTFATMADATGAIQTALKSPGLDDFDAEPPAFDLFVTANDQTRLAPEAPPLPPQETFAATQIRVSEWAARVAPFAKSNAVVKRGKRVKVVATGWADGDDTLYVHYLRGVKVVHSARVGALKGDCGDLTANVKAFAFKNAKPGTYAIRFSTSKRFDAQGRWLGYTRVRLAA